MQSVQKTRFVAGNYANLQGLKVVPLGLLLLLVVVWANGQHGPARNLALLILLGAGAMALWLAVRYYYQTHFGRVIATPRQQRLEMIMIVLGGGVGLVAFLADITFGLPVSFIGLVFAGATLAEYLRMQWYAPGAYLLPVTVVWFSIMLVVSILPLLGAGSWWLPLGLRSQLFGVAAVAGVLMVCVGVYEHIYLVRQLPGREH